MLFPAMVASFALGAADNIPEYVCWSFHFQGTGYETTLTKKDLLASPSWSPEQPLPLTPGEAVAIARTQIAAIANDVGDWSAREIQLHSANPRSQGQRWYYAIHFFNTQRASPKSDYIIVCVDFSGRAGTIKPTGGSETKREDGVSGRYQLIEGEQVMGVMTLYADHSFANEKGDRRRDYRWEFQKNALVLYWLRARARLTNDGSGVFLGVFENTKKKDMPVRLEREK